MTDGLARLLLFNVQGNRYALDLRDVAEVLDPPPIYPVPWSSSCLKGAINSHGSLVAVLDLATLLEIGAMSPHGNVLVLDRNIASLALWVDGVENIVPAGAVLEEEESSSPLIEKLLIMADGSVAKLSTDRLLASVEMTLKR